MSLYSIGYLYTSTETKNDASMLWTVVELGEDSQQWILLGNYLLIVLPEINIAILNHYLEIHIYVRF